MPTQSLVFGDDVHMATSSQPPLSITAPTQKNGATTGVGVLDTESGLRILDYIHSRGGGITVAHDTKKQRSGDALFFTPSSLTERARPALTILDKLGEGLGLSLTSNVKHLTLDVLVANDMSLRILLEKCRVSVTNLKNAGIVTRLDDLKTLRFRVKDMVRDRELFDAGRFKMFYNPRTDENPKPKTCFQFIRDTSDLTFDLEDVVACQFYPGELETLGVSLNTLIREDGATAADLCALKLPVSTLRTLDFSFSTLLHHRPETTAQDVWLFNLSMGDLCAMGFARKHLERLGVREKDALRAYPDGFGWSKAEYRAFLKS